MEEIKIKETTPRQPAALKTVKKDNSLVVGSGMMFRGETTPVKGIFTNQNDSYSGVSKLSLANINLLELAYSVDNIKDIVGKYLSDIAMVTDIVSDKSLVKAGIKGLAICATIDLDELKKFEEEESEGTCVFDMLTKPTDDQLDFKKLPEKLLMLVDEVKIFHMVLNNQRCNLIKLNPVKVLTNCILADAISPAIDPARILSNFEFNNIVNGSTVYYSMTRSVSVQEVYNKLLRDTGSTISSLSNIHLNIDGKHITICDLMYTTQELVDYGTTYVKNITMGRGSATMIDPHETKVFDKLTSEVDVLHYRYALLSGKGVSQVTRILALDIPSTDYISGPKSREDIFSYIQDNTINRNKIKSMFSDVVTQDKTLLLNVTVNGIQLVPEMTKVLFKMSGANNNSLKIAFSTSPEFVTVRLTRI